MPNRVGRYEIQAELARGGFGRVYRAYDPNMRRLVALKMLACEVTPEVLLRFRQEATSAGNLKHNNIITIYESGEYEGSPFIAMEFLEGNDLQKLISNRYPLTIEQKVDIMLQVAEGLACAHRNGVVHRDIKPANIMVLPDGTVKIMDFGIARFAHESAARLTQTGFIIGTLMYMAPEQFTGEAADAVSDIFAYGVTYYEFLCGRHPFSGGEPGAVMSRINSTIPRSLRTLVPECPEGLERIVNRAMAKNREERYSSLSDVIIDTRPILLDLQREQAEGLFEESQRLFAAGKLDAAQSAVRKVLELDPMHAAARQVRTKIEGAVQRRAVAARAASLLEKAEQEIAQRQYVEAGESLAAVRQLRFEDSAVLSRLERLTVQLERASRSGQLMEEARADLRSENLTEAFRAVSSVLADDPSNAAGQELLREIQASIAAREAKRRLRQELERAEGLLLIGDTEQALAALAELERQFPGLTDVWVLRTRAEAQQAEEKRARKLADGIAGLKVLLKGRQFEAGVAQAAALLADFPGHKELQVLQKHAAEQLAAQTRADQIAKLKSETAAWISNREFDRAIRALEAGVAELGDDSELTQLLQSAAAGRAAQVRERAVAQLIDETARMRREEKVDDAAREVERAIRRWGNGPPLPELLKEINEERENLRALRELLQQGSEHLEQGKPEAAATLLRPALNRYPERPEIRKLLDRAESQIRERMRARQLEGVRADVLALTQAERWQEALERIDEAFQTLPADPSLISERSRVLAGLEQKNRLLAERQDRERNLQRAINRVKGLLVMESFDDALQAVAAFARDYPESSEIEELAQQARRQSAEKLRRQKLEDGMAAAKALVNNRALHDAAAALEELRREFPLESEPAQLLAFVREELAAEERNAKTEILGQQAWALARSQDFDRALAVNEQGLKAYPGDEAMLRLRNDLLAAKSAHEKARALREATQASLQRGLAQCRQLRERGSLNDAVALAAELVRDHADSLEAAQLLDDLRREAREAEERRLARERELAVARDIAGLLAQAARREESGDFAAALQIVEEALRRYPASLELKTAVDRLRAKSIEAEALGAIQSACAEVERLLAQGQLDRATERLARARRDCRPDARFDALDAKLNEELFRQQRLAEAQEHLRNRRYDQAEQSLNAILQREAGDARALELLASIAGQRSLGQRKQRYADGRTEAEQLLRSGQFARAIGLLETLLAEFPDDPLLKEDLRLAQSSKDRSQRYETVALGRAEASEALQRRDFASAIRILQALQKRFPDDISVADDLQAAIAAKNDLERKEAYAAGRAEAERMLAERDFNGAIKRYQALLKQFPNDPLLSEGLQSAVTARERNERKEEAAKGRDEAQRLMRERQFDRAIARLEALTAKYPEDIALADDLKAAIAARAGSQRREAYATGRAEAEKLASAHSFDEAIRKYQALLKMFAGDAALEEGLASVKSVKAAEERKQLYTRGRAEAELLSRERKFDAAIAKLESLLAQFPRDTGLEEDLRSVRAARALREQRLTIDEQIAQLEKRYRKGDARGVKEKATTLLAEMEEPRARELLNWAESALARKTLDASAGPAGGQPSAPTPGAAWRWIAAFVTLLAAASVMAALGLFRPSAGSVAVAPQQLEFLWQQGAAAPTPKTLTVKASGAAAAEWTFKPSDEWLVVTRGPQQKSVSGQSELTVSVATGAMEPGSHSGLVAISAGTVTKNVRVKLTVLPAKAQPAEAVTPEPALDVLPLELAFRWTRQGASAPERDHVYIQAVGSAAQWTPSTNAAWLKTTPSRGGAQPEIMVALDPGRVPKTPGSYAGGLVVSGGGLTRTVRVTLIVEAPDLTKADASKADASKKDAKTDPRGGSPADPPVTDKPVDCNDASVYFGRFSGNINWSGSLPPDGTVTVGRALTPVSGPGALKGDHLPGCRVTVSNSGGITIEQPPASENNFSRLRIKNASGAPLDHFSLHWQVVQKP